MLQNLVAHLGAANLGAAVSHHVGSAVARVENSVYGSLDLVGLGGISKL